MLTGTGTRMRCRGRSANAQPTDSCLRAISATIYAAIRLVLRTCTTICVGSRKTMICAVLPVVSDDVLNLFDLKISSSQCPSSLVIVKETNTYDIRQLDIECHLN